MNADVQSRSHVICYRPAQNIIYIYYNINYNDALINQITSGPWSRVPGTVVSLPSVICSRCYTREIMFFNII